jgi:hypothetical protein
VNCLAILEEEGEQSGENEVRYAENGGRDDGYQNDQNGEAYRLFSARPIDVSHFGSCGFDIFGDAAHGCVFSVYLKRFFH